MKKIGLLFFIVFLTSFDQTKNVYICGAKGAKKYHYSETCRGLNACKHEIVKKSLKEAQNLGLELCGWED
jgi:hypothetical protein